jgi:hypothetical protein
VCVATASASPSARSPRITATDGGTAAGQADGGNAEGTAIATGRGRLIGASTFKGTARGTYGGQCLTLTGTALLRGRPGAIRLVVSEAQACAATAESVSFSGSAKVTRGTSTFAGARGKLTFKGTYVAANGALTISFRGRITY